MKFKWLLAVWILASAVSSYRLTKALPASANLSSVDRLSGWHLPGETTHGHGQIELKCQACHDRGGGVREESCHECHGAALKDARDTHPKKKFDDPSNAHMLTILDARSCLSCHAEHAADRTEKMGVSVPQDFCWQCHQDVAEDRPSHAEMAFDSCSNAGCHNYHDNTALYENFLSKHLDEPSLLEDGRVTARVRAWAERGRNALGPPLGLDDQDGPGDSTDAAYEAHVVAWSQSGHAAAGVNCSACHQPSGDSESSVWSDAVSTATCGRCHQDNVDGWHDGLHGLRPAAGLPPMRPELARLPMQASATGTKLDCNVCHGPHETNTLTAAADSCLQCHADSHSLAWTETAHAELWRSEVAATSTGDNSRLGIGVSCATCHLPRRDDGSVEHNQNATLEPSEKMVRQVCLNCHGTQFSLDALASEQAASQCYGQSPTAEVDSLEMVRRWFEQQDARRRNR